MKKYRFAYGSTSVEMELDEKQVMAELGGNAVPPIEDIPAALNESLEHPVDSQPLSALLHPGMKLAVIVSDMSRFWMRQDLVVPHLITYINRCGIPDQDITIIIANGTHIGGTEQELRQLVTDAIYERIHIVNHDCLADDLVTMGTTSFGTTLRVNRHAAEADLVICLGACTHHVMAGFGGGRKSILPGISAMDTICQNHALALDSKVFRSNPLIGNGVTKGNPLNEDMCEAASLMPNLFMVNLVMNADQKLAAIYSGHYLTSWEAGCRKVDSIYRVPVKEKADVIVASCGGYPKDMSLYQGTKTIDNIEFALKPGGTLILLIEARDGGGPDEYFGWIRDLTGGTMEKRLREHFTIPGYIFLLNCEQAQRYRIMMLSSVDPEVVRPMGLESYQDIDELLAHAELEGKKLYVIRNGATVIPTVV